MRRLFTAAAIAAAIAMPLAVPATAGSGLETIVKIDAGYVAGLGGEVRTYKGIPYAAPPVGPLRWKAPQPVTAWQGIRLTKTYGAACATASEDCLTLNVWTPAKKPAAKLPVIFWIHGGGFTGGSSSTGAYDGAPLAHEGVVVVSINYRLGHAGYFAHPELSKESADGVSGNQGMLDMVQALKWVKTNIAGFGGDPGNVTIFGESAGGAAVGLLMVMPSSEGLFHKAVAASPWNLYQPISHLRQGYYGRPSSESAGAARGTLAALRAAPVPPVTGPFAAAAATGGAAGPYPIVDGVVIPDDPAALFEQGKFHNVPVMIGGNSDDGSISGGKATDLADARAQLTKRIDPAAANLLDIYGAKSDAEANAAVRLIIGDATFNIAERQMLRAVARRGGNAYGYEFTRAAPLYRRQSQGAIHAADVGYFLGTLPDSAYGGRGVQAGDYDAVDERVSHEMMGALVQFARTGIPNGRGLPRWPKYTLAEERYLDWGDKTVVRQHLRKRGIDALWGYFESMMQKRGA